jgi:succinoglycan biosynthesis protein ExoM
MGPGVIEVSVCICTFHRPARLLQLLRSLQCLAPGTPRFEVIVVDNDPERTGEPAVSQARANGLEVHYAVEPVRGIARARNRSVAPARGEYVAFIDDDEEADPQWLANLLPEVLRFGADGGIGPVIPKFSDGTPRWLIEGGFFERPRLPTGTILGAKRTRTGNALIRRRLLTALPGPFNDGYDLTGGEDSELFRHLVAGGARFIAVDSAIVYEHLSSQRTTIRWLLQRRFMNGMSGARLDYTGAAARPRGWRRVELVASTCKWGVLGLAAFPFSRTYGLDRLALAARLLGRVAFLSGFSYRPYLSDSWR